MRVTSLVFLGLTVVCANPTGMKHYGMVTMVLSYFTIELGYKIRQDLVSNLIVQFASFMLSI